MYIVITFFKGVVDIPYAIHVKGICSSLDEAKLKAGYLIPGWKRIGSHFWYLDLGQSVQMIVLNDAND